MKDTDGLRGGQQYPNSTPRRPKYCIQKWVKQFSTLGAAELQPLLRHLRVKLGIHVIEHQGSGERKKECPEAEGELPGLTWESVELEALELARMALQALTATPPYSETDQSLRYAWKWLCPRGSVSLPLRAEGCQLTGLPAAGATSFLTGDLGSALCHWGVYHLLLHYSYCPFPERPPSCRPWMSYSSLLSTRPLPSLPNTKSPLLSCETTAPTLLWFPNSYGLNFLILSGVLGSLAIWLQPVLPSSIDRLEWSHLPRFG